MIKNKSQEKTLLCFDLLIEPWGLEKDPVPTVVEEKSTCKVVIQHTEVIVY